MRATTAFRRMLGLPGLGVQDVRFGSDEVVVVAPKRWRAKRCPACGARRGVTVKDWRTRRWRHLDLAAGRCIVESDLRRLCCRRCGQTGLEAVSWARLDSSYTRDFEDVVAWLAQQLNTTKIAELMRIGWSVVGDIARRVVAEQLDSGRLDGLVRLGVDEIHHAYGHQLLTCVADHDTGRVVWAQPGRCAASLQAFFDALSPEQRAISMDMSAGYEKAVRETFADSENPPQVAFDRFHVIQLGGKAIDKARRQLYNQHGRSTGQRGRRIKGARYSLLKRPENQTVRQLATLHEVQITNRPLYRASLLLHELRGVYEVPAQDAPAALKAWLA